MILAYKNYSYDTYDFNGYYNKVVLLKNIIYETCFFIINTVGFGIVIKGDLSIVNLIAGVLSCQDINYTPFF